MGMTAAMTQVPVPTAIRLKSVILLQPAGEHLAILLVSIDKAGMAGVPEQMPLAVWDVFIERSSDNGGADVAGAAADKSWLRDLAQFIRVLKVLQTAERLILIGAPAIEVGFRAGTLRTADAFRRVFIDTDYKLLEVMIIGPQVVGIVPSASGLGTTDSFLVLSRQVFDEPVLLTRPQAAGGMTGR